MRQIKITASFVLALLLLALSACGSNTGKTSAESTIRPTEASAKSTAETPDKPDTDGKDMTKTAGSQTESAGTEKAAGSEESSTEKTTEAAPIHDPDSEILPLRLEEHLTSLTKTVNEDDMYFNKCSVTSSDYVLSEGEKGTFEVLGGRLENVTETAKEYAYSVFSELSEASGYGLCSHRASSVFRADSRILSILGEQRTFRGEETVFSLSAVNIDSATGEALTFRDVVKDPEGFWKLAEKRFVSAAGGPQPVLPEDGSFLDDCPFIVGHEGVTVYYTAPDGSEGRASATVFFDEAPELFDPYFAEALPDYIEPFFEGCPVLLDVDGNGVREEVKAENYPVDEYRRNWKITTPAGELDLKAYAYDGELCLVRSGGKYYLYIFQTLDDDYVLLYAADLADLTSPGTVDANFTPERKYRTYTELPADSSAFIHLTVSEVLTDPENMVLESRKELLGNSSATGVYTVGTDGYPVLKDPFYTTAGINVVEVNADLPAKLVDEKGAVLGDAVLPAGTLLYLARSDYSAYADVQIPDPSEFSEITEKMISSQSGPEDPDRVILRLLEKNPGVRTDRPIYRLTLERGDWYYNINGQPETEVFSGIMYGG